MAAMLAAIAACGCAGRTAAAPGQGLRGSRLEVVAVWSGVEEQHFQLVLRAFERQTGVTVSYLPAGYSVPAFLQARLARGQPPDVAFLPQPGLLRSYAAEHLLVPLDPAVARVVAQNYDPAWQQLGSADGRLYGVWFKAANKSLIWYNEGVFERVGVAPPADLAGLELLAGKVAPRARLPSRWAARTAGRWRTGSRTCTWAWPARPAMTCSPGTAFRGPIPPSRRPCG